MFTAIHRSLGFGRTEIDILATRDTNLTEAMADVSAQSEGPGALRLATATRVSRLLDKAQQALTTMRALRPLGADEGQHFTHNDPDLGLVTVTWIERP